jgi:hypothetical protein
MNPMPNHLIFQSLDEMDSFFQLAEKRRIQQIRDRYIELFHKVPPEDNSKVWECVMKRESELLFKKCHCQEYKEQMSLVSPWFSFLCKKKPERSVIEDWLRKTFHQLYLRLKLEDEPHLVFIWDVPNSDMIWFQFPHIWVSPEDLELLRRTIIRISLRKFKFNSEIRDITTLTKLPEFIGEIDEDLPRPVFIETVKQEGKTFYYEVTDITDELDDNTEAQWDYFKKACSSTGHPDDPHREYKILV